MKNLRSFLILSTSLILASCQTTGGTGFSQILEGPDRPKIALVLGGGAARGFAHVGVIRARWSRNGSPSTWSSVPAWAA